MKANEIRVGGIYIAKVNGKLQKVRVDNIRKGGFTTGGSQTAYDVTNLATGRTTTFRSAAKFREEVKQVEVQKRIITPDGARGLLGEPAQQTHESLEVEQRPDPTTPAGTAEPSAKGTSVPTTAPAVTGTCITKSTGSASRFANGIVPKEQPKTQSLVNAETIAGYKPTQEQREILLTADQLQRSKAPGRVMVIAAGAGTGKTSTLRMLEEILEGMGQYTAFNASLVAESKAKFKKARCNTTHSLAFKEVGRRYAARLKSNRIRSEQVASMLGLEGMEVLLGEEIDPATGEMKSKVKWLEKGFLAGQVMQAVKKFCQSADREIGAQHFRYIDGIDMPSQDGKRTYSNNERIKGYLVPFAQKAWKDLSDPNGRLPFHHDVYVKVWQLGEGKDRPFIPASYILLDEAQDTAPVLLDILKQQTHALVILVGDDNQQIYDWRGAVNAMGAFPGAPRRLLSQSFRFGQAVADVANSVLATLEQPTDLVMKGFSQIPSRVDRVEDPKCILCRTNALAIGKFLEAIADGKKPFLVGGSAEMIEFCKAALDLQADRPARHPELSCFSSWKEVQAYVKTDEGEDLKLMVKLVDDFGAQVIIDALEKMPEEKDADMTISTAHRSKGREWKSVKLAQDFPTANRMSDADRRLLYVAVTRAQYVLDITCCPPFCGGQYKAWGEDGEEMRDAPGLSIRYTVEMPGEEQLKEFAEKGPSQPATVSTPTPAPLLSAPSPKPQILAVSKPDDGWQPNPDKPRDTEFTWANKGGVYVIRGPKEHENQAVTVRRRNGTTMTVRLGGAVEKTPEVWFYKT